MSNTTTNPSLSALLNAPAPTAARAANKTLKPIGNINIKLQGVTVFSRSVWKESTSETVFLNELNDLAQGDPEKTKKAIAQLLSQMTVEINTKQSSDLSLESLLNY